MNGRKPYVAGPSAPGPGAQRLTIFTTDDRLYALSAIERGLRVPTIARALGRRERHVRYWIKTGCAVDPRAQQ